MPKKRTKSLLVQQVNCFHNYTAGFEATEIDLVETAANFLKSGIARSVCFSDLKSVYLDKEAEVQVEWIQPQGRKWDSSWAIKFSEKLPSHVAEDLIFCLELSFHEKRIEGDEAKQMPPHLRAALPPFVLEQDDVALPIYPWIKLYSDGIATLSFQVDTTWDNLDECDFIQDVVNLFQQYFDRIWVQAEIQRLDAEQILPEAYEAETSLGGQPFAGRRSKRLLKDMRRKSRLVLEESLRKGGQSFDIGGESWTLHQIAGSDGQDDWESTMDICRSLYVNAVASLIATPHKSAGQNLRRIQLWQGRPSISLIRFAEQPATKSELFESFGQSMSRILARAPSLPKPPPLPIDLRPFEDYSFHGNRSLLLWTWLRPPGSPDNAWKNDLTRAHLFENQARAEHFEYHNLRIARACSTAASPSNDEHLVSAYKVLASAESTLHHSSQAGEITDAIEYLLEAAGTSRLIAAGKEQARWHLDERRYRADKNRSRVDRWLTAVFGLVGTTGLANLVVQPFLSDTYPDLSDAVTGLCSFLLVFAVVGLLAVFIWVINKFSWN
ncbi:hypothetical protein [Salinisphaera hydrothermalis]|uniref:hypothetical protein n=1 Tax=Salinisphaera hydrothermalis TaxID=563188 RepID=UPI0012EB92D7|nr:hypothetical protein [Salinisphaera hydrothermalis]